jgi:hypothetical protein
MIRAVSGAALVVLLAGAPDAFVTAVPQPVGPSPFERLPYAPRTYLVQRSPSRLIVDGRLDEAAWRAVPWSDAFVDIEGDHRPRPRFATRVKMLWDAGRFYVAAEMEEPDLWATLTERDAVIFRDHDFEVFVDPDGDTHDYYELEVNVLGTVWDLLLKKPYRDGGPALNGWDIAGLDVGIDARGTINAPGDRDDGWTVEIAMPWPAFAPDGRSGRAPAAGDRWRVNFSRVEWRLDVVEGRYVKRQDAATGRPLAEDNWVWSPQGAIAMHMPERWGIVQFVASAAGAPRQAVVADPYDPIRWALRRLYYRQAEFRKAHGRYAETIQELGATDVGVAGAPFRPVIDVSGTTFELRAPAAGGATVRIRQDGRVRVEPAGGRGSGPKGY